MQIFLYNTIYALRRELSRSEVGRRYRIILQEARLCHSNRIKGATETPENECPIRADVPGKIIVIR